MNKKELMEEVLRLGQEVARLKRLAKFGLYIYQTIRLVYGDDVVEVMNRVKELDG